MAGDWNLNWEESQAMWELMRRMVVWMSWCDSTSTLGRQSKALSTWKDAWQSDCAEAEWQEAQAQRDELDVSVMKMLRTAEAEIYRCDRLSTVAQNSGRNEGDALVSRLRQISEQRKCWQRRIETYIWVLSAERYESSKEAKRCSEARLADRQRQRDAVCVAQVAC